MFGRVLGHSVEIPKDELSVGRRTTNTKDAHDERRAADPYRLRRSLELSLAFVKQNHADAFDLLALLAFLPGGALKAD